MCLWIKYDSVSFKAAETCQHRRLFSDSIAAKWQFKSGGLSLSWQVFNLCSISAHCRALFCTHCFWDCLSSPGLCCFLAPHLSLLWWDFFSFFPSSFFFLLFPLIVYSSCLACLVAHNPLTFPFLPDPKPLAFPASCFFPPPFSILPSLLLSSPFFYPTGLEMQIAPLFLTSVLLGD